MMKLLTHESRWQDGETVVVLGEFDGVHVGHAKLMRMARALAHQENLQSVVYTYSTHPMAVISPENAPLCLHTRSEKIAAIAKQQVDAAILRPFDAPYAAKTPEAFAQLMASALHPKHVVIGFNYSFGCEGAGKAQDMVHLGEQLGFTTHIVDAVMVDGESVSSSRVRAAIEAGNMDLARRMMGRPYALSGVVIRGKGLGRTLRFPTANLPLPHEKVLPPAGVYAAMAYVRGNWHMAAVNIGRHPTLPEGDAAIEANLIDYVGSAFYGNHMRLLLYHRVREERQFDSIDALRVQIAASREQIRAFFSNRPHVNSPNP